MKTSLKNLFACFLTVAITVFIFSTSTQAQENPPPEAEGKTVIEVVETNEETSEFAQLLKDSGYEQILKRQGTFTVIAPKNEAIEQIGAQAKENPQQVVQGHLFQGEISVDQIEDQMGVTVEKTDESAANGIVHVVDQVSQN